MRVYLPAFYSLELFCLPGNILGFHFAIARASNDFHSRNLIIILLSLFYIQYILWKECLLCNGCNAILFKVTVRYQALQLQLGLMVTPMLEDWCEVFFLWFFFWSCSGGLLLWKAQEVSSVGAHIVRFPEVKVEKGGYFFLWHVQCSNSF